VIYLINLCKYLLSITIPYARKSILPYAWINFALSYKINLGASSHRSPFVEFIATFLSEIESGAIGFLITHIVTLFILFCKESFLFVKFYIIVAVHHAHLSLWKSATFYRLWIVVISWFLWIDVVRKKGLDEFRFWIFRNNFAIKKHLSYRFACWILNLGFFLNCCIKVKGKYSLSYQLTWYFRGIPYLYTKLWLIILSFQDILANVDKLSSFAPKLLSFEGFVATF
jgi:hypothetical protein